MSDLISRQAAIDAICSACGMVSDFHKCDWYSKDSKYQLCEEINSLRRLPSAQPEIIRCKDCKWKDENWRRVSVRWLPCMLIRPGDNWFCGCAERRTDETD